MSKLIALYKRPSDPQAFDLAYFSTHLPLISHLPGLERIAVTRFTRTVMGEDWYLMAEMVFADRDSLKTAMRSPEMAAAGTNLSSFAEGLVTLLFGEEQKD